MKKLITYLLLACLVIQSTSQLWILASFYLQRDYIANYLCINRFEEVPVCNGQCFLNSELKKDEEKQEQQFPDLKYKEIQLCAPLALNLATELILPPYKISYVVTDQNFISSGFIFSIFHPPKVSFS